jgi:hypothetical protein
MLQSSPLIIPLRGRAAEFGSVLMNWIIALIKEAQQTPFDLSHVRTQQEGII